MVIVYRLGRRIRLTVTYCSDVGIKTKRATKKYHRIAEILTQTGAGFSKVYLGA
jgi:hypothetical protein